ncbi:MAG: hypothetical protein V1797_02250, partial [Pseudomonadota bacterium]
MVLSVLKVVGAVVVGAAVVGGAVVGAAVVMVVTLVRVARVWLVPKVLAVVKEVTVAQAGAPAWA